MTRSRWAQSCLGNVGRESGPGIEQAAFRDRDSSPTDDVQAAASI